MIRKALIALAIAQSCSALAQTDDAALRRELDELKARMSALEKRLSDAPADRASNLSARPSLTASAVPSSDPSAWLRIKQGMTREEIKSLLGEPKTVFELDGSFVWYYRYNAGSAGSVFFDSAGHTSGFQRPSGLRVW